jgi:hypothetical protein
MGGQSKLHLLSPFLASDAASYITGSAVMVTAAGQRSTDAPKGLTQTHRETGWPE